MNDPILQEALERGLADKRGLYISPAGLGESLRVIELPGAKAAVQRFLVPLSLRLESPQGVFEFKGFRDAKAWLAAVQETAERTFR